ncbi:protein of unknown function [Candidatus Hydrogenisulfobacillus filiaventi]|uniref:Uncharacterized protein n=1 Tax=Candidatus Hydrogenisulfobacillus filiaventi TaxID=2707344 RepID=A0A6F8ZI49_9FIRM|nr:protein of unknown function [Candidatus Hydrogenisulfobacillus filiaventi]
MRAGGYIRAALVFVPPDRPLTGATTRSSQNERELRFSCVGRTLAAYDSKPPAQPGACYLPGISRGWPSSRPAGFLWGKRKDRDLN